MTSNIALFSVLFLAVIVAIAFWHKCNIGILAIGGAFILGTLSGMSGKEILAVFESLRRVLLVLSGTGQRYAGVYLQKSDRSGWQAHISGSHPAFSCHWHPLCHRPR